MWSVFLLAGVISPQSGAGATGATGAAGGAGGTAGTARQEPAARQASDADGVRTQARDARDRALAWLLDAQNEDGSWASPAPTSLLELGFSNASYYAWQMASVALACEALRECPETPERRATLERALAWLCSARMPKRGNDWDNDAVWTYLCGFDCLVAFADDERFAAGPLGEQIVQRAQEFLAELDRSQAPSGGWGYYDFGVPGATQRPKWGTSFSTALVLPALARAFERGWSERRVMLDAAVDYVSDCALPNGAYEYDLNPIPRFEGGEHINQVKGSLGRIQVCNWALAEVGIQKVTEERIEEGLAAFFEHHQFLVAAHGRPIPHEAYYANAGYFYYFGHHYAARVIALLPEAKRASWYTQLAPCVWSEQASDGSLVDFAASSYLRVAETAYGAMALNRCIQGR